MGWISNNKQIADKYSAPDDTALVYPLAKKTMWAWNEWGSEWMSSLKRKGCQVVYCLVTGYTLDGRGGHLKGSQWLQSSQRDVNINFINHTWSTHAPLTPYYCHNLNTRCWYIWNILKKKHESVSYSGIRHNHYEITAFLRHDVLISQFVIQGIIVSCRL